MNPPLRAIGNDSAHNWQLKPFEKGETKCPPNTLRIKRLSHRKQQSIFHCLFTMRRLSLEFWLFLLSWTIKVSICIINNSIELHVGAHSYDGQENLFLKSNLVLLWI